MTTTGLPEVKFVLLAAGVSFRRGVLGDAADIECAGYRTVMAAAFPTPELACRFAVVAPRRHFETGAESAWLDNPRTARHRKQPPTHTMTDTRRCIICGCPMIDHIPLRYVLRAWIKHCPT